MIRCAIYARVSDEAQLKGESIDHQISYAKLFARRRGMDLNEQWVVPDDLLFVDGGITGTSMLKRPAVRQMITSANQGRFDVVLFKGISRFARDTVDALVMLRTLISSGVRIISMEENYDSQRDKAEFVFTIHSALAQAESEKTAIRVRMGAMEKARQGKWNGRPPDGYELNRETKRLDVDELFAPIIRDIFSLYLQGHGCRWIAGYLNDKGICTRQGNLWSQRNIARLLRNPAYVGDVVYGRRTKRRVATLDGRSASARRIVKSESDDIVQIADAHPAIVTRREFEEAAEMMSKRQHQPGRRSEMRLLGRGLLQCQCSSAMTVKYNGRGTPYYRCAAQVERGPSSCRQPYVRAEDIERAVMERALSDVANVLSFDELRQVRHHPVDKALARIADEQAQQSRRTKLLFAKYAEGIISDHQFAQLNRVVTERQAFLRLMIERLTNTRSEADNADVEARVQSMLAKLGDGAADPLRRILLETVVDHVRIIHTSPVAIHLCIAYRFAEHRLGTLEL